MGERYRSVTSVSWYTFTSRNTSLITYSYEGNRQMLHRKQNAAARDERETSFRGFRSRCGIFMGTRD